MALHKKYEDKVAFIVVDVQDETKPSAAQLANMFKISYIPAMFFIDSEGTIVDDHVGIMDDNEMENKIKNLIK